MASISFLPCGCAIPFRIVERNRKLDKWTVDDMYQEIVREVRDAGLNLRFICADSKDRKKLLGLASTCHTFGCEVCLVRSRRVTVSKKKHISYGYW